MVLFGALNGLLKDNVSTNLSPIVALINDDYKVTELLTCVDSLVCSCAQMRVCKHGCELCYKNIML